MKKSRKIRGVPKPSLRGENNPAKRPEVRKKISDSQLDEKNSNWKGNEARYSALHSWARRHKPKPKRCEKCRRKKEFLDLSNISGKYKRDLKDWEWLCRRCHMKKDGRLDFFKKHVGRNKPCPK